jgi:hypothetical protein
MNLEQILNDVKRAAEYKLAILADGTTDETVRVSPQFLTLSEDDYGIVRAQALEPIYAAAADGGTPAADIAAWCYGKGIAKAVVDSVAANLELSRRLQGQA